jgi:ubiquinone/menaquinone biosynthesis C-methylase UbiE
VKEFFMHAEKKIEIERENARIPDTTPWDERVTTWEEVAASPVFERLAQRVLQLASPTNRDVVVDLGAGTGLLAIPVARLAERVIAVDYSETMLRRLKARASEAELDNVECVRADLREIPLEDASADAVVSNYAFHHLPDDGKELALAEARRVLRPGGRLVVCDMMFALSLGTRDRRIVAGKIAQIARKGPAGIVRLLRNAGRIAARRWEHPAPPERWREMLEARRFVDIQVETVESEAGIAFARRPPEARA